MTGYRRWVAVLLWCGLAAALDSGRADAVLLTSAGNNCNYIAVANYAVDYANKSSHLPLVANCFNSTAKNSNWQAYNTCAPNVTPGDVGRPCWGSACNISTDAGKCASGNAKNYAPTCSSVAGNTIESQAQSWLSLPSIRKGALQYYASDHKSSGLGYCDLQIGQSSFRLSFEHYDGGKHFNLSLQAPSQYGGGPDSWTTTPLNQGTRPPPTDGSGYLNGAYCPGYGYAGGAFTGPLPAVQSNNSQWAWGYPGATTRTIAPTRFATRTSSSHSLPTRTCRPARH